MYHADGWLMFCLEKMSRVFLFCAKGRKKEGIFSKNCVVCANKMLKKKNRFNGEKTISLDFFENGGGQFSNIGILV